MKTCRWERIKILIQYLYPNFVSKLSQRNCACDAKQLEHCTTSPEKILSHTSDSFWDQPCTKYVVKNYKIGRILGPEVTTTNISKIYKTQITSNYLCKKASMRQIFFEKLHAQNLERKNNTKTIRSSFENGRLQLNSRKLKYYFLWFYLI